MYLKGCDAWDIVSGDEVLKDDATEDEKRKFRKRDQFALSKICLSVSDSVQIYVRSCKTAKAAWKCLKDHFEENTLSRKVQWYRKLFTARMGNSTMEEHVNNLRKISEHLEALGDPVKDNILVMVLISSLPESYNNLVTTLETLNEKDLTWEYTRDKSAVRIRTEERQKEKSQ